MVLTSVVFTRVACAEDYDEAKEFCTLDSAAQRTRVDLAALAFDVRSGRHKQNEERRTSRDSTPGVPLQSQLTSQQSELRSQASNASLIAGSQQAAPNTGTKHRALHAVSLAAVFIADSMMPPRTAVNQVAGAFGLGSPFSDSWASSAPQQLQAGIVSFADQFPARQVCAIGTACLGLVVVAVGFCCLWVPRKGMRSGTKLGEWGKGDPEPVLVGDVDNPECANLLMLMPVVWGHAHGVR